MLRNSTPATGAGFGAIPKFKKGDLVTAYWDEQRGWLVPIYFPHQDRPETEFVSVTSQQVVELDETAEDLNIVEATSGINRLVGPGRRLFSRPTESGRVDVRREGNTIRATTEGVGSFRLLLSPDLFDFSEPIVVVANDSVVFEGRVELSLETLLKWAARDNDRTMLYGAELEIRLD